MNERHERVIQQIGEHQKEQKRLWLERTAQNENRGKYLSGDGPCYYCDLPSTFKRACDVCIHNPEAEIFD